MRCGGGNTYDTHDMTSHDTHGTATATATATVTATAATLNYHAHR